MNDMSKKIQTVIPDHIAQEIEMVIKKDRFIDQSEFVRHCIREYLNNRELKANEMEAIIAELDQTADDLLNDYHSVEQGKDILAKVAPLKAYLKNISKNENSRGLNVVRRERLNTIKEIISEYQKEYNSSMPLKYIIRRANDYGLMADTVEDLISKLKSAGDLIESATNEFRIV